MAKLSIIIPCYNEGKCIKENICNKVLPFLESTNLEFEIILVNDGSKDDTKEVINLIPGVVPVSYDKNRGKGGAVKEGILKATGDYILFMDADLSTDLSAIYQVKTHMHDCDFIIGSRHLPDSILPQKQPWYRQFIGWCCRKLVNLSFGFKYSDTQCGFKAMKASIAKDIANKQIIDDFAFDVEYLYYAKLNNIKVMEIPVTWINDKSSTVSLFKSSLRFMKDMHRIKKNKKKYII